MSKFTGTGATIEYSSNGGSTYTEVNNVTSISPDLAVDLPDSTDNDDAGFKSHLMGDQQLTLSVECLYDAAAGQRGLRSAARAGTLLTWRYRPEVGTGLLQQVFAGRVSALTDSSPHAETTTLSFTVVSSGAITESNQT